MEEDRGRQVLCLDCQNITTNDSLRFNLQDQVNYWISDSSVAVLAPGTVAWVLVPVKNMWSP